MLTDDGGAECGRAAAADDSKGYAEMNFGKLGAGHYKATVYGYGDAGAFRRASGNMQDNLLKNLTLSGDAMFYNSVRCGASGGTIDLGGHTLEKRGGGEFLFNGAAGLLFGRFYRKYGIQYAMLAHMLSSAFYSGLFETVRHEMPKEEAQSYVRQLRRFFVCGWADLLGIKPD